MKNILGMLNLLVFIMILVTVMSCGQIVTGPQGPPGLNGSCSVTSVGVSTPAPNGGSVIRCADGTSSLILNGTNGTNGTAGSVVTSVKFCPGNTVYPTEFNELGFCISNKLYGVYSANGGFLTEIVPGTYGSNGINASCNFLIGSNCSVSN